MSSEIESLNVQDVGPYADLVARPNPHGLVLHFTPALVAILHSVERQKGVPLTQPEAEAIRDRVSVIAMPAAMVAALEGQRGYRDIDPAHCWREWLVARSELAG